MEGTALSIYADNFYGYVAVRTGGRYFLKTAAWAPGAPQSVGLVQLLEKALAQAGFPRPEAIIAPRGPASFTTLRITLTVAQAVAFCFPEAYIFAPSYFAVRVFSERRQLPHNEPFVVLLDAFKMGFYGAEFEWCEGQTTPCVVQEPAFYGPSDGARFLEAHKGALLITDFSAQSFGEKLLAAWPRGRVWSGPCNGALTQLALYDTLAADNALPQGHAFSPFYLHTPEYAKVAPAFVRP